MSHSHVKGGGNMSKAVSAILASVFTLVLAFAPVAGFAQSKVNLWGPKTDIENNLGLGTKDVRVTVASIINVFMGLLGIVAVCIILIGGFLWMTAGGNEDKTKQAKQWILSGIIGLIIILSSYAIATFVVNSIISAT